MTEPTSQAANRRNSHRRAPKEGLRIACYRDAAGQGPDLAISLLDASQTGLRMLVREPLAPAVEVLLVMQGPESAPVTRQGLVMWAVPSADGSCDIGVQFHKRLMYKELLGLTQIV